ncbi:MAG: tryptophan-rich sensory protein [Actinomycetota bacterium]|nr:tryptophan-rich sensory protein [Actinomycetota bacterium]
MTDQRTSAPARSETPTTKDRVRQLVVTVSYLLCLYGSLLGSGVIGDDTVEESSGGSLSDQATHIAPGGPAFSIWSVIYLGLAAYVIFQWLPRWAADPRQRAIGYLAAASMVLNAAWLFAATGDQIWLSVLVIVVLLAVLCAIIVALHRTPSSGTAETLVVDGTFGLYLGWVTVATAANIAAALVETGFEGGPLSPDTWAVLVLVAVAVIGSLLALRLGGRVAPTLAIAWGLSWVAIARVTDEPESMPTAVAAIAAAAVVIAATLYARARRGSATG